MPTDTLVRSSAQDDIFDLNLSVISSRTSDGRTGEINLGLTDTCQTGTMCDDHTAVTCWRTCGGISGRPCAC